MKVLTRNECNAISGGELTPDECNAISDDGLTPVGIVTGMVAVAAVVRVAVGCYNNPDCNELYSVAMKWGVAGALLTGLSLAAEANH